MYVEGRKNSHRNKYWSKEQFLNDLRVVKNIKGVCETYSDSEKGWRAYYLDVSRWRRGDVKFNMEVQNILTSSESSQIAGPGRPPKDGGDKSWQDDFCEALYEFDGNRRAASAKTPYSFKTILDMLNPGTTSYDKDFADKVLVVEAEIAAEIEQMFLGLRRPENFSSFEDAKIAQTKAWYAMKALEKLDKSRYGRFVEMNVKGKIEHEHTHQLLPREQRLFALWEEQRRFLSEKAKAFLPENTTKEEVIDVEEVKDGNNREDQ